MEYDRKGLPSDVELPLIIPLGFSAQLYANGVPGRIGSREMTYRSASSGSCVEEDPPTCDQQPDDPSPCELCDTGQCESGCDNGGSSNQ